MSDADPLTEFRAAMLRTGITPPDSLIADGLLHRFTTNGKANDDAGWYVLYDDGLSAGAFGDWLCTPGGRA